MQLPSSSSFPKKCPKTSWRQAGFKYILTNPQHLVANALHAITVTHTVQIIAVATTHKMQFARMLVCISRVSAASRARSAYITPDTAHMHRMTYDVCIVRAFARWTNLFCVFGDGLESKRLLRKKVSRTKDDAGNVRFDSVLACAKDNADN